MKQPDPRKPPPGSNDPLDDLDQPRRYPLEEPEWAPPDPAQGGRGKSLVFLLLGLLALAGGIYGKKLLFPPEEPPAAPKPAAGQPAPAPERPKAAAPPEDPVALQSASPADEKALAAAGIKGRWRMVGRVFDLMTLKPVPGARLIFKDPSTRRSYKAKADAQGRFKAAVPSNVDGYNLSVGTPKYRSVYMEDWIPSVTLLPREKRQEIAQELGSKPQEEDHVFSTSGEEIEKSYVLIPIPDEKEPGR
jgi:hypothetical protein